MHQWAKRLGGELTKGRNVHKPLSPGQYIPTCLTLPGASSHWTRGSANVYMSTDWWQLTCAGGPRTFQFIDADRHALHLDPWQICIDNLLLRLARPIGALVLSLWITCFASKLMQAFATCLLLLLDDWLLCVVCILIGLWQKTIREKFDGL